MNKSVALKLKNVIVVLTCCIILLIIGNIVGMVMYGTKSGSAIDYHMFSCVFTAVIGLIFHATACLNFALYDNFKFYIPAYAVFSISDICNVVYDISYLVMYGEHIEGYPSVFVYLAADALNLLFDVSMILYAAGKLQDKLALTAMICSLGYFLFYNYPMAIEIFRSGDFFAPFSKSLDAISNYTNIVLMLSAVLSILMVICRITDKKEIDE